MEGIAQTTAGYPTDEDEKTMALDGASLMIVRQALNAFCEFHNISLVDELALEAADQLVKMVLRGEGGLDILKRQLEDWLASYLGE